jgi:hypothetical protein
LASLAECLLSGANQPFDFEGFGDEFISSCEWPLSSKAAVHFDVDLEN